MKKLFIFIAAALIFAPLTACRETSAGHRVASDDVKNVILMVGDGMGLTQVTALMLNADSEPLNLERATVGGFVKTISADSRVTDSAAAATAFATGRKTKNGYLSVSKKGRALETILEKARKNGLATGLVATTFIEHATPAAFYAHTDNRRDYPGIASQLADAQIDVVMGDANDLADSTVRALAILADRNGFFLMVEGSHIDTRAHENDLSGMLSAMYDFDRAVGVVLDFADANPGTLVVIVGDHETGGLTIPARGDDMNSLDFCWSSPGHTATMVPLFAYGTQAQRFGGILDNTEVNHKLVELLLP